MTNEIIKNIVKKLILDNNFQYVRLYRTPKKTNIDRNIYGRGIKFYGMMNKRKSDWKQLKNQIEDKNSEVNKSLGEFDMSLKLIDGTGIGIRSLVVVRD